VLVLQHLQLHLLSENISLIVFLIYLFHSWLFYIYIYRENNL
jgi:hypothetical protein